MKARRIRFSWNGLRRLISVLSIAFAVISLNAVAHEGLEEQVAQLTRRIEGEPQNAELYLRRGELYRQLRQFQNAQADYDRAGQRDSALVEIDFYRGRLWLEAGRFANARTALDAYLKLRPSHVEALFTRAKALEQLKDYRAAVADYSRAITLAPRPTPDHYIERSRVQAAGGALLDAVAGLDEGISKLGPIVTMQSEAIELELRLKRWDAALQRLDNVAGQSPRKESYLERRGAILMRAGRPLEARASYSAALKAIEALPQNLRQTKAMVDLEQRTRAALLQFRA